MYWLILDWVEQNWQKQGRFWKSSAFDNSRRRRQNGEKKSHNWHQINTYRNTRTWRSHWSRCWNRGIWKEIWTDQDRAGWQCSMTWYDNMICHDLAKTKWALKGQGYVPVPETTWLWQPAQSTMSMLMTPPKVNYLLTQGCLVLHHNVVTGWNWEQK